MRGDRLLLETERDEKKEILSTEPSDISVWNAGYFSLTIDSPKLVPGWLVINLGTPDPGRHCRKHKVVFAVVKNDNILYGPRMK